MIVDIYSHHFVVRGFIERGRSVLIEFALRIAVRDRSTGAVTAIFAGSTKSRNEFRYHINSLSDFKRHLADKGYDKSMVEYKTHGLAEPDRAQYYLNPSFVPRDQQIPLIEFLAGPQRSKLLTLQTGKGKAQPLDALIKIPGGWTTMGQVKPGDKVTAVDGTPSVVTGVYPQGNKEIYRVTFSDGRSTECCAEHLWRVYYINTVPHRRWRVVNTLEMSRLLAMAQPRVYIDLIDPEGDVDIELPIDPYLLGALLGDGCSSETSLRFSNSDTAVIDLVSKALPDSLELIYKEKYDYGIRRKITHRKSRHELIDKLRMLGLHGKKSYEKFIPDIYMNGSASQRLALLRGLLDTDGTVGKEGHITYTTTSMWLSEHVIKLVRSLGGIASVRERMTTFSHNDEWRAGRTSYTIGVRHKKPTSLFSLPRKRDRLRDDNQYSPDLKLRVMSVELVGRKEAQCISIDHPSRLYVTNDYIATHNTACALAAVSKMGYKCAIVLKGGFIERWLPELYGPGSMLGLEFSEVMVVRGLAQLKALIYLALAGSISHIKVYVISIKTLDEFYAHYDLFDGDMSLMGGIMPWELWELLGVGVKVNDEVHMLFHQNYRQDLYGHVLTNIYLSATMIPSSHAIELAYNTMFPPEARIYPGEYDKYIVVKALFYGISFSNMNKIRYTRRGSKDYSHTEFEKSILKNKDVRKKYIDGITNLIDTIYIKNRQPGQRMIVFCATVDMCSVLVKHLKEVYPNVDTRRFTNVDPYTNVEEAELIVTTIGSLGTAHDVSDLRYVLMTTALGKEDTNVQVLGRLRKLKNWPDVDPEFYYLVCRDIAKQVRYHNVKVQLFEPLVKSQNYHDICMGL